MRIFKTIFLICLGLSAGTMGQTGGAAPHLKSHQPDNFQVCFTAYPQSLEADYQLEEESYFTRRCYLSQTRLKAPFLKFQYIGFSIDVNTQNADAWFNGVCFQIYPDLDCDGQPDSGQPAMDYDIVLSREPLHSFKKRNVISWLGEIRDESVPGGICLVTLKESGRYLIRVVLIQTRVDSETSGRKTVYSSDRDPAFVHGGIRGYCPVNVF